MSKQVYISADYDENSGDRDVVELLNKWGSDSLHKVNFIDMSKVASGSVSDEEDCRICDLKAEFNRQINSSSAVIFIVGDKTGSRTAGSECERASKLQFECYCTPYKHNVNGKSQCKISYAYSDSENINYGYINNGSYLKHEFKQAEKRNKKIIIFYNSERKESNWLPAYMKGYENIAVPFWINENGIRKGNYAFLKEALGF